MRVDVEVALRVVLNARVVTTRHNMTRQDHHRADKGPCYEHSNTYLAGGDNSDKITPGGASQYTVQTKSIIAPVSTQS